jgi:hypothetical protein
MKKILIKNISHIISALIIFAPILLLADSSAATIKNPLKSDDIQEILLNIMELVAIVGGIVVVLFIIYSGFTYVTASGDTAKITKAREMFFATIIGGAILLGADVIATVVINTVKTTAGTE